MLGKKLGKNRIRIIELIVSNPNITYSELSEALSVSSTTIENRIAEMSDVIIKRVGPKNGGHWEVIENLMVQLPSAQIHVSSAMTLNRSQ